MPQPAGSVTGEARRGLPQPGFVSRAMHAERWLGDWFSENPVSDALITLAQAGIDKNPAKRARKALWVTDERGSLLARRRPALILRLR
jgi:hypothetical protein